METTLLQTGHTYFGIAPLIEMTPIPPEHCKCASCDRQNSTMDDLYHHLSRSPKCRGA